MKIHKFTSIALLVALMFVLPKSGQAIMIDAYWTCEDEFAVKVVRTPSGVPEIVPLLVVGAPRQLRPLTYQERIKARKETVASQIERLAQYQEQLIREERADQPVQAVKVDPNLESFLTAIYQEGALEWNLLRTGIAQDKLFTAELMRQVLGPERYGKFFAKTVGLSEYIAFLREVKKIEVMTLAKLRYQLRIDFPNGFILKPTTSGQGRESHQVYWGEEGVQKVFAMILSPKRLATFVSSKTYLLDGQVVVTTAEEFILQEVLPGFDSDPKKMAEYRVHSLEDRVVKGATLARWHGLGLPLEQQTVEEKVAHLLLALPQRFLRGSAFSFDVLLAPSGDVKIIEINSAQAMFENWSGYLTNPLVLAAYVRAFERDYPIYFSGISGWQLRNGLANWRNAYGRLRAKLKE